MQRIARIESNPANLSGPGKLHRYKPAARAKLDTLRSALAHRIAQERRQ